MSFVRLNAKDELGGNCWNTILIKGMHFVKIVRET